MKDNGTDRDVALLILSGLDTCATLVASVNDNLYVPHIVTQPTNQTGDIDETVTFTVVANNVASYQWQFKPGVAWQNSSSTGYNTASLEVEVTSQRYGYDYRCRITGKDGSVITTDVVKILAPGANG